MQTHLFCRHAINQEHSLHLEWKLVEACDSPPLLCGIPALVLRKVLSQTEIPWVSLGQRLRKGRSLSGVVANSQILRKASRHNELSFITCSPEALPEQEKLACTLVLYCLQLGGTQWGVCITGQHQTSQEFIMTLLAYLGVQCLQSLICYASVCIQVLLDLPSSGRWDGHKTCTTCWPCDPSSSMSEQKILSLEPRHSLWSKDSQDGETGAWRCHQEISPYFRAIWALCSLNHLAEAGDN